MWWRVLVGVALAGSFATPGPAPAVLVAAPAPIATAPVVAPVVTTPAVAPVVALASPRPVPVARRGTPWFATPEAAMRYLTWAYNGHHETALRHVTTPSARAALVAMRAYAPTIQLKSCATSPFGGYQCEFTHTVAAHPERHGTASFAVGPAIRHGWYMTVLESCGDDSGGS